MTKIRRITIETPTKEYDISVTKSPPVKRIEPAPEPIPKSYVPPYNNSLKIPPYYTRRPKRQA